MRQVFISYARENKPDVEALVQDLGALGCQTWVDSHLRGGQTWWEEIVRRIADCDVFLAIVSRHTLNSVACKRELEWALALNKPVLPVAVERRPEALPRTLSMRQIVDYSKSGREAAFALAGALATLPPAPPPPEQLPEPPPAPLSYLSDLIDQVSQPDPLTHEQQHQILIQLQPALRSVDLEERQGGRYVLETFSKRNDLYADVDRTLAQLGLAEHDTQPPTAPEVAAERHDHHAPTAPEAPAEGRGNLLADPQWADALSAFFAERWVEAVQRFEALQGRYPGEGRVKTRLDEARRQRDIDAWSAKAEAAAESDWDTAVSALEKLTALDPTYPDATARLEQARIAQRRRALVDEMTALHQAGRWDAVVAAAQQLARLDPDNPDPGGIVSDARAKIREADLADRYAQALNHLDQEHWQQAVEVFTAIEQEHPGYRDAAALLKTAQQNLTSTAKPHVRREQKVRARVTATVPVGILPTGVAVDPGTHTVYVANRGDHTVSVIDGSTRAVTATVPVGYGPEGVAVDPGTHTVYAANRGDGTVSVIDGSTHTVTATLPGLASKVAVDPVTHTVYVTNFHATHGTVSVIDGSTRAVTATVPVGRFPNGVAVDPGTHTVYAANYGDGTVSVIDGSTRAVTATVPVGYGPEGVAVDPGTHTVYAANYGDDTVSVIDGSTHRVSATVPVGASPVGVAVDPGTHTVYAANYGDGTVSVIEGSTHRVSATVPVGRFPNGVAVDPGTHTVYVANNEDGTVSVIEPR